jgi:hypothetical protein
VDIKDRSNNTVVFLKILKEDKPEKWMQLIQFYSIIQLVRKSSEQQRYEDLVNIHSSSLTVFIHLSRKFSLKTVMEAPRSKKSPKL